MALLEYGASQLAVIATKVGHCEEVVGKSGRLVPPSNPEAIAEAMAFYLEQPDRITADAEAFHEVVRSEYSSEVVIPKLLDIYKT